MAAPLTKRHATLVRDFAAGAQSSSQTQLDFSEGSVLLAIGEGIAGLGTWLQKLYIFALSVTRLTTSYGVWVDTFIATFGMTRLPAAAATGNVTFARYGSPIGAVAVPVGTQVATADGRQAFQVYADPSNAAYSPTAAAGSPGYVMAAGANTVDAPVRALVVGKAGNVAAQTIQKLQSPASGIDAVINTAAFTTGIDRETDLAVKARFILFIAALASGTETAIRSAVVNLQQGLTCEVISTPGIVTVYVDDGSGEPDPDVVALAASAVNAVRAGGVQSVVLPTSRLAANVQMIVEVGDGYRQDDVVARVTSALSLAINGLGPKTRLPYTRLEHIAYDASPGVINVTDVLLNGGTADLVPGVGQRIKVGNVVVDPAV